MAYSLEEDFLSKAAFPVTIDPVTYSSAAKKNVHFSTLAENWGTVCPTSSNHIKVGVYNGKNCVSLLKLLKLAPLKASDTVILANLRLFPKSSSTSRYVAAYPVKKAWDRSTVTWVNFDPNNVNNVDPDAVECVRGSSATALEFDLISLYRQRFIPYEDSEGMSLKLTYRNNGTLGTFTDGWITIVDKGHNEMRFNVLREKFARLVSVKDASGNTSTDTYGVGDNRIAKIADPVSWETEYSYDGDLLSSIRVPDTEKNT